MELASLQEKLKEKGWNFTNDGLNTLSDNGKITDVATLTKKAIDLDLRGISQGTLPDDISKSKYDSIPGNIVLQIQKIKNLSSPKSSEANSGNQSLLKLSLTDGVQTVQAVQMDNIHSINMNTFPGSKIYVTSKTIDVSHCFLLLFNSNTQFLGGKVDSLVEKWELNRSLAKHTRGGIEEGGPPPWIPFGEKIIKANVAEKNFKSLDIEKTKDSSENSEFEAQRKGAILEATKIGSTKIFGGGNNKLLDYNVKQIVDAGFTIEDAEYALKICKNNLDRALRNLQAKYNKHNKDENAKSSSKSGGNEEVKKGGKGRNKHKDEDSGPTLKPSGKVSLFDFLEDKLPYSEPIIETRATSEKKNTSNAFKGNPKSNVKPHSERGKAPGEEKRGPSDKSDSRTSQSKKGYESSKSYNKFDPPDRRNYQDKKVEFGKFESNRQKNSIDSNPRTDKSFGNFKYKAEHQHPHQNHQHQHQNQHNNGAASSDYNGKAEFFKNKSNDKRSQSGNTSQSAIKNYNRSFDINEYKKQMIFAEKPPRFKKFQNQQSEQSQVQQQQPQQSMSSIQNWNEPTSYNRSPQSDYQLQNSLANLTLQQNLVNFQNQNTQDAYGDILAGVTSANSKPSSMFYQNVVLPTSQAAGDSRIFGSRSNPQQPSAPPQSHLSSYGSRNTAASYLQEVKSSNFPTIPNLQECAFKNTAPVLHGYSDFQSIFAQSARGPSTNNFPSTQFVTNQNGIPPQPSHKAWIWKKGDKCMARYWEDQMFYNAVVTAVSENTCVVKFTDYGNYEEVLQDHCYPITEES